MKSTGERTTMKDLREPAPHVDAGFFRQVYGERSMYLSLSQGLRLGTLRSVL